MTAAAIPADLERWLADHDARGMADLDAFLRIPSVSARSEHNGDTARAADWLRDALTRIGFSATVMPTPGHPIVLGEWRKAPPGAPTILIYGHYDVQPPEPLELWKSPPFEPRIDGCNLFARGSCDNKGQHFAHLKAVEAYLKTGTELPCDLTFLIEGEEEIGCENLAPFLRARKRDLRCEAFVISDNGLPSKRHPALGVTKSNQKQLS